MCCDFSCFVVFYRKQLLALPVLLSVLLCSVTCGSGQRCCPISPGVVPFPRPGRSHSPIRGVELRVLSRCLHLPEPLLLFPAPDQPWEQEGGSTWSRSLGSPGAGAWDHQHLQMDLRACCQLDQLLEGTGKSLSSLGSVHSCLKGHLCRVIN